MSDSAPSINREARDATKGFRFQKLRAVKLVLEALERGSPYIYCAVENIGDVYLLANDGSGAVEYIEEDKDYSRDAGFSINHSQIQKSFVAFIDAWHVLNLGPAVALGFCTTATIAKERSTELSKSLGIVFPSEPVLELIQDPGRIDSTLLLTVRPLLLSVYESTYSNSTSKGNLQSIRAWDDNTWLEFLSKISWSFGVEDEKEVERDLVLLIQQAEFYSDGLAGKERHLLSVLVDEFDRRQCLPEVAGRLMNKSDVLLLASKIEAGSYKIDDPAWEVELPTPEDRRNLGEKLKAISPDFNPKLIASWSRAVAISRVEQKRFSHDKSLASLRYRVFGACYERLIELIVSKSLPDAEWLEYCLGEMEKCAVEHIRTLSLDYQYLIKNKESIRGIILELIDSCFLSFDEDEPPL